LIPNLNKDGYLPKVIHKATIEEIEKRFGIHNPNRKELFANLNSMFNLLHKHKAQIKSLLLNGSFVSDKEEPGDIDCILIVKKDFDFDAHEARLLNNSKNLFNIHLIRLMEEDYPQISHSINFFGHDREGKPKGILEVIL